MISGLFFTLIQCKDFKNAAETSLTGNKANIVEIVSHKEKKVSMGNGQFYRNVFVTVKNTSSNLIQAVNLKGIWYDKNNTVVGTGVGTGLNIPAGQTKIVEIMAMEINDDVRYEIQVDLAL
jgi:hypothetical protein